jgi:serine/threonine-protein kinase
VYLVEEMKSGRQVALKILDRTASEEGARRFLREGKLLSQIRHPNVIRVHEVAEFEGLPYLVMDFAERGSLGAHLRRRRVLGYPEACRIMVEVLEGLQACHDRGIVHRDLKPVNILLDRDGHARVADLGLATVHGESSCSVTRPGKLLGTPRYMSPEQCRGMRAIVASDIYAAGVILYELISGRLPFEADNVVGLFIKHRTGRPPPLDQLIRDVPAPLVCVIERAMEKSPGDRPASARDLGVALARFVGSPPAQGVFMRGPVDPEGSGARYLTRILAVVILIIGMIIASTSSEGRSRGSRPGGAWIVTSLHVGWPGDCRQSSAPGA